MGRSEDSTQRRAAGSMPPTEEGANAPEGPEGMGLSSEHEEGQVQEVDSREEP